MLQGLGIKEIIDDWAAKYFPLAVWLAKKLQENLPSGVEELHDLIGAASLGLVSCLHRYDPSQGTSLSDWVSINVRWALLDYLRSLDLLPQERRKLVKLMQKTEEYLEQWFQRKPTRAEIATLLGCSEEDVEKIMQMGNISIALEAEEDSSLSDRPEMGRGTGRPEKFLALQECFAALTVEEKVAVRMYGNGATLKDVADVLHMPLSSTGRLVSEARQKLEECIQ